MQLDSVDVSARIMTPLIVKVGERYLKAHGSNKDVEASLQFLKQFDGDFSLESVPATIYATWQHFFYRGLLYKYTRGSYSAQKNPSTSIWSVEQQINLLDHDSSADLYQRLLTGVASNDPKILERYDDKLCGGTPYADLGESQKITHEQGKNCEYNVIRSLQESQIWLRKSFGEDPKKWKWGDVHLNDFENIPWSVTPLKYIFHRSVPFAGNSFTINVARYPIASVGVFGYFKSMFSANYKQVLQYGNTA